MSVISRRRRSREEESFILPIFSLLDQFYSFLLAPSPIARSYLAIASNCRRQLNPSFVVTIGLMSQL